MKGGCSDLRTAGPNGPVKVIKAGRVIRTEEPTTIEDFQNGKNTRAAISHKTDIIPYFGKIRH